MSKTGDQKTMNSTADNEQKAELRKFGFIMAGMIVFLFALLSPWLFGASHWPIWPYIVAAAFVIPAVFSPRLLRPVNSVWLKVGHLLGWINSRIILGVMFFLIILPIGLLLKIFGKDSMNRTLNKQSPSYRKLSKPRNRKHLERPF